MSIQILFLIKNIPQILCKQEIAENNIRFGVGRLKILQIIPHFGLGGAETMCKHLSEFLQKAGNEVTVISLYDIQTSNTEHLEKSGMNVIYLNKKSGFDITAILKLKKIIHNIKPDVIHTHLAAIKYAFFASVGTGVKLVHTVHSVAQKESGKFAIILNKIFLKSNRVVFAALSEEIQSTIKDVYKLKKENIPVVLNGIDLENCMVKKEYSLHTPISVAHVASFQPVKNHIELLKSIVILKNKGYDVNLFLYGDGAERSQIEKFISDNDLFDTVHLCGFQKNVMPLLFESDIFVLPSKYEGIPMSIIEAMGTGMPVVASNVGGILDMIIHEENGLFCKPVAESIAQELEKFIKNQNLRERCGKNAVINANRFSVQNMVKGYMKIYKAEE